MRVFLFILVVYFIGVILGMMFHSDFIQEASDVNQDMGRFFSQNAFENFMHILKNNLFVNLYVFICSVLTVGFLGIVYVFLNGFIHGLYLGFSGSVLSFNETFLSFIPHFSEIFALVGSVHLGYLLSMKIFFASKIRIGFCFLFVYALIVFCVTIVSAYLESYVSMQ